MSILINKDTKIITQGITGKTGQFHTEKCIEYANGKNCFVAGVNPKKAGEKIFDVPIFASVKEAKAQTGATVSVIYVPPPGDADPLVEEEEPDVAGFAAEDKVLYHGLGGKTGAYLDGVESPLDMEKDTRDMDKDTKDMEKDIKDIYY